MHVNEIFAHAKHQPFFPFNIYMDDGSVHSVPHPEVIFIDSHTTHVGVMGGHMKIPDYFVHLDNGHVSRIELVYPKAMVGANGVH